jgi:DinB superfamily
VHAATPGTPHTIYQELWHLAFWQQVTLDWIAGLGTPCPAHAALGFPTEAQITAEPWEKLRQRFLDGAEQAAAVVRDGQRLEQPIRCPSCAGKPVRVMTVREQLESLTAHNAYHLGRIVLLRQLHRAWPPPSGGFTW